MFNTIKIWLEENSSWLQPLAAVMAIVALVSPIIWHAFKAFHAAGKRGMWNFLKWFSGHYYDAPEWVYVLKRHIYNIKMFPYVEVFGMENCMRIVLTLESRIQTSFSYKLSVIRLMVLPIDE